MAEQELYDPTIVGTLTSCGAVVLRARPAQSGDAKPDRAAGARPRWSDARYAIEVLMIQHAPTHWGFPKGHSDAGEDEHTTARREILEETGVEVRFLPGFRDVSYYDLREDLRREIIFFLAEPSQADPVLHAQEDEVFRVYWQDYRDALPCLNFGDDANVLRRAVERFCGLKGLVCSGPPREEGP